MFSSFLDAAALSDGGLVNMASIARECGVSAPTVKGYFGILEDTLLGRWLPGYTRRPKRRVIAAPKFYFSDVGVVNHLARRGRVLQGSMAFGLAFENWVFHELAAAVAYRSPSTTLAYWRLASGIEVDFVVGDMHLAVEAKATERVTDDHVKGLRALHVDHPRARRVVVSLEPRRRVTRDGIEVLPWRTFAHTAGDLLDG